MFGFGELFQPNKCLLLPSFEIIHERLRFCLSQELFNNQYQNTVNSFQEIFVCLNWRLRLQVEVPTCAVAVEKILDSMKGEADLLHPIRNDVSWSTTTSYLPSAFPVLLFYPCLLSAGLACSCGAIAELRMCSERWVKRCPSQCCLHLPQITGK